MKQRHITIKDIAKTLGVSASTVSRALKDHPDISDETKQQVQQLAQSVKYRPNTLALGLRKSKTNTIGVVVPEIVHHFFSTVISGMDDAAYERGYSTVICQTNENADRERINIQTLLDSRVDGMLISVSKSTENIDHFRVVADNDIPVVFFDRVCEDIPSHRVITDDFEGARIATRHLLDVGCQRIAYFSSAPSLIISKNRLEGYKTALGERGIDFDPELVVECDSMEKALQISERIITLAPDIDGIFAINDDTAIGVIKVLRQNGYRIPDDIAVIGFGDGPHTMLVEPTLSTVQQKGYDIGYTAMERVIEQIEKDIVEIDFETRIFTPTLVARESTRRK